MTLARHKRELSVAATYAALLGVLAIATPRFFQQEFLDTWVSNAPMLIAAVGMTLVILAKHIDISIGSQFSICAVIAAFCAKLGWPMPVAAGATLVAGCAMGAINGIFVALIGLPSIVVTLATMVMLQEALRLVRQGAPIYDLPADFQWFGQSQLAGEITLLLMAALVFAVFAYAMKSLAAGRAVYAVGSDTEAARLAGVRPKRVVFGVFVLMGLLTGLAALLQAVRFTQITPYSGNGLELAVIAAVVVGGTAISGGRGTILGSLLGVALLGTITAALIFLGGEPYWEKAIQGAVILIAVASDALRRRGT